jgi:fructose-1,6-bisphosphatase
MANNSATGIHWDLSDLFAAHDDGKIGTRRIMDITPTELHQRIPLVIGSAEDVEFVARMIAETAP